MKSFLPLLGMMVVMMMMMMILTMASGLRVGEPAHTRFLVDRNDWYEPPGNENYEIIAMNHRHAKKHQKKYTRQEQADMNSSPAKQDIQEEK